MSSLSELSSMSSLSSLNSLNSLNLDSSLSSLSSLNLESSLSSTSSLSSLNYLSSVLDAARAPNMLLNNPLDKYLPENAVCAPCYGRAGANFDRALSETLAAFDLSVLLELNMVEADSFLKKLNTDAICQLGRRLAAAAPRVWCGCAVGRFHTYALCITDTIIERVTRATT